MFQVSFRPCGAPVQQTAHGDNPAQLSQPKPFIAQLASVERVLCRTELFMGLQKSAVKIPTPLTTTITTIHTYTKKPDMPHSYTCKPYPSHQSTPQHIESQCC